MNSAMNVEYVYMILYGISEMFDSKGFKFVRYNSKDKVKIDNVSINDSHLWDVTVADA